MIQLRTVSRLATVAACSFALVIAMGPAFAKKEKHSGYLSDYSQLKKEKDPP